MDYKEFDELCKKLVNQYKKIDKEAYYIVKNQATDKDIREVEKELQVKLPKQIRQFFLEYTKYAELRAFLPDQFIDQLSEELSQIFSACFVLSLGELKEAELDRRSWVEECFSSEEDEYDQVWHNKLGFMNVGNGDIIAFDLKENPENPPIVYLSHDDGEGHGYILGKDFENYILNLVKVGACGQEDWQMLPFITDKKSGIDPDCMNAIEYRKKIGFEF